MKSLSRAFSASCVIFTAGVFLFYLLANVTAAGTAPVMELITLFALYCASLVIAISSVFLLGSRLPRFAVYILHYVCCVGSFLLIFMAVLGRGDTGAERLVFFAFSSLLYAVFMLLRAGIVSIIKHRSEKD